MRNTYSLLRATGQRGLFVLLALAAGAAHGQSLSLPAVGAQSLAGTYADLGAAGTAIATANFDDANSAAQDIGFSFTLGGSAFTQFVLNTNGYVRLGATAPPSPYFSDSPFLVNTGPLRGTGTFLLLPFNADLEAAASGGTEYRVATTGSAGSRVCTIQWKNVSDKSRLGASTLSSKEFASFSFQLKLYEGTNQVDFVYGPAVAATITNPAFPFSTTAQVGIKGAGTGPVQVLTVVKTSNGPWSAPTFQDGLYPLYSTGFTFTGLPDATGNVPLPDAGRTYRFSPPVANDLAVSALYSVAQLPAGQAYAYRAYVTNPGSTSVSGQTATLTLSGANTATVTVAVPTLATGATATVRFPGVLLPNAGTTTATATVPTDGNPTNNSQAASTTTTSGGGAFSVIDAATPSSGSSTFLLVPGGPYTSAFAVKYRATTAYTLNYVRARLGSAADNPGNVVYGVVADTTGRVLAQSAPYTMQAGDDNKVHTFVLTTPVQVPAGSFLAGLAQVVQPTTYPSPLAYQPEVPTRPGTYYQFGITTPSAPVDITLTDTRNYRYLIEAGYSSAPLATQTPTLAGTLTVYPNPSATGQLTLDVRDAGPGPLAVQVLNALGQCVYTGTARPEAATPLNLTGLASGVYYLQVRSGAATNVLKLALTR